jgi:uncharacterized protein YqgC (DUF456 family)
MGIRLVFLLPIWGERVRDFFSSFVCFPIMQPVGYLKIPFNILCLFSLRLWCLVCTVNKSNKKRRGGGGKNGAVCSALGVIDGIFRHISYSILYIHNFRSVWSASELVS